MATVSKAMKTDAAANSLFKLNKRIVAKNTQQVLFGPTAGGAVEMAICYPVAYNKSTGKFAPWMAPAPSKIVVTLTGGTGTWGLTINGVALANTTFAHDVTAALAKETILQKAGYVVSVVKASAVYTITFDDVREVETLPTLAGDVTQISGGSPTAVATAGTATNGTQKVYGFAYPVDAASITTHTSNDTIGVITQECEIVAAEAEALVATGDVAALRTALKDNLNAKGIIVQGLVGVH